MGFAILVLIVGTTLWSTVTSIMSGTTSPTLKLLGMEQFERSENAGFFWGIIGFNWLVAAGMGALILTWMT